MNCCSFDLDSVLDQVRQTLGEKGIDFERCGPGSSVKVVCIAPDLGESVREMGRATRDQVVMVRVDADTAAKLDAWVETGAVRSRSEAAALFIREGLNVRATELGRLRDALAGVEKAKQRLRREARGVFNLGDDDTQPG
jgi:hypothetical protein